MSVRRSPGAVTFRRTAGPPTTHSRAGRPRTHATAGADLIKVMASGGALTPTGPRMWEAQFTAIAVCRCVSGDWQLFRRQLGAERADAISETIRRMRKDGVRFIAGTDAGVPGAAFGDYVGMLDFFVTLGFGRCEVLDMATTGAAHALGLTDTGALTTGMRADLIVTDGNPLTDPTALRRIRHVFAAGRRAPALPPEGTEQPG
ncbi:amidohydrolase family protein [Streptomyces yunnanensis]|uniref:amidohydrolase family protein n=1 Tax=Streptomyces yunnanensis TaxID=156453 RepID=UPI002570601B|nr:amidohydrolase family protein [Streptomyces yunnanensis]